MSGKAWRWIVILAVVASVLMALRLVGPAVPNEIRMLTGPGDSNFYADGLRYKEILSRHGVTVHLEETGGTVENLAGLAAGALPGRCTRSKGQHPGPRPPIASRARTARGV